MTHVEAFTCLDIHGPRGFADSNSPHPARSLSGGAIVDFLPHLDSPAHPFFVTRRTAEVA